MERGMERYVEDERIKDSQQLQAAMQRWEEVLHLSPTSSGQQHHRPQSRSTSARAARQRSGQPRYGSTPQRLPTDRQVYQDMQESAAEWREKRPHLRVVGKSLGGSLTAEDSAAVWVLAKNEGERFTAEEGGRFCTIDVVVAGDSLDTGLMVPGHTRGLEDAMASAWGFGGYRDADADKAWAIGRESQMQKAVQLRDAVLISNAQHEGLIVRGSRCGTMEEEGGVRGAEHAKLDVSTAALIGSSHASLSVDGHMHPGVRVACSAQVRRCVSEAEEGRCGGPAEVSGAVAADNVIEQEEGVCFCDGQVEEVFAQQWDEWDGVLQHVALTGISDDEKAAANGLPPVSPKSSIYHQIMQAAFDQIWKTVLPVITPAILENAQLLKRLEAEREAAAPHLKFSDSDTTSLHSEHAPAAAMTAVDNEINIHSPDGLPLPDDEKEDENHFSKMDYAGLSSEGSCHDLPPPGWPGASEEVTHIFMPSRSSRVRAFDPGHSAHFHEAVAAVDSLNVRRQSSGLGRWSMGSIPDPRDMLLLPAAQDLAISPNAPPRSPPYSWTVGPLSPPCPLPSRQSLSPSRESHQVFATGGSPVRESGKFLEQPMVDCSPSATTQERMPQKHSTSSTSLRTERAASPSMKLGHQISVTQKDPSWMGASVNKERSAVTPSGSTRPPWKRPPVCNPRHPPQPQQLHLSPTRQGNSNERGERRLGMHIRSLKSHHQSPSLSTQVSQQQKSGGPHVDAQGPLDASNCTVSPCRTSCEPYSQVLATLGWSDISVTDQPDQPYVVAVTASGVGGSAARGTPAGGSLGREARLASVSGSQHGSVRQPATNVSTSSSGHTFGLQQLLHEECCGVAKLRNEGQGTAAQFGAAVEAAPTVTIPKATKSVTTVKQINKYHSAPPLLSGTTLMSHADREVESPLSHAGVGSIGWTRPGRLPALGHHASAPAGAAHSNNWN